MESRFATRAGPDGHIVRSPCRIAHRGTVSNRAGDDQPLMVPSKLVAVDDP